MKFVVFGARRRLGMVDGERVLDLESAASAAGTDDVDSMFGSLHSLIEAGDAGLDRAAELLEKFSMSDRPGLVSELAQTHLHAPFPGRRFALAGSNNAAHVANYYMNHGQPTTAEDVRAKTREGRSGGFWAVSDPVGPGAEVPLPTLAGGHFDYEGEIAVVLGTGGKHIRSADAGSLIWGTVLVIDWSIRSDSGAMPWYGHKNFDASKSLGPWISVGEVDPMDCVVETRVNGEIRQKFNNGEDMIYSYAELIEQISADLTIHAGDLLAGGTGPGTVLDATPVGPDGKVPVDRYLKVGDTVEVSAGGLGSLRGSVVDSDRA